MGQTDMFNAEMHCSEVGSHLICISGGGGRGMGCTVCISSPQTICVTNLGGNMARFTQFPLMITRSTIIYKIISPGAAGSSIYV